MKKLLLILTLLLAPLAHAQLTGPGVNCHDKLLPVGPLQKIGVKWVRMDWDKQPTERTLKEAKEHYDPLPILVSLPHYSQDDGQAVALAKKAYRVGIRDIETGQEVEGTWWVKAPLTPEQAADRFVAIWQGVPSSMRCYGPSLASWKPEYIDAFLARLQYRLGLGYRQAVDGLAIHLYWTTVEQMRDRIADSAVRWNLPLVCTEISSRMPGWDAAIYPEKRGPAELFLALRQTLGAVAWCWYDGPAVDGDDRGLFRWDGKGWAPTPTYEAIVKGLAAASRPG